MPIAPEPEIVLSQKPQKIWARYLISMYETGRAEELPYEGMMFTTVLANARRIL